MSEDSSEGKEFTELRCEKIPKINFPKPEEKDPEDEDEDDEEEKATDSPGMQQTLCNIQ